MVGPAFARHARTDSPQKRGGETIFSLSGLPAGRSWRRRGRALRWRMAKRFGVKCSDQAGGLGLVSICQMGRRWGLRPLRIRKESPKVGQMGQTYFRSIGDCTMSEADAGLNADRGATDVAE